MCAANGGRVFIQGLIISLRISSAKGTEEELKQILMGKAIHLHICNRDTKVSTIITDNIFRLCLISFFSRQLTLKLRFLGDSQPHVLHYQLMINNHHCYNKGAICTNAIHLSIQYYYNERDERYSIQRRACHCTTHRS